MAAAAPKRPLHMTLCRLDDVVAFKQVRMVTKRDEIMPRPTPTTIDEHKNASCALVTPRLIYGAGTMPKAVTLDLRKHPFAALVRHIEPPIGACLYTSPMITVTDASKVTTAIETVHGLLKANASPSMTVLVRECVPDKVYADAHAPTARVIPEAMWPLDADAKTPYTLAKAFAVPVNVLVDKYPASSPLELHLCGYLASELDKDGKSVLEPSKDDTIGRLGMSVNAKPTPDVIARTEACIRSRLQSEAEWVRKLASAEAVGRNGDDDGAPAAKRRKITTGGMDELENKAARLEAEKLKSIEQLEELKRKVTQLTTELKHTKGAEEKLALAHKTDAKAVRDMLDALIVCAKTTTANTAVDPMGWNKFHTATAEFELAPALCLKVIEAQQDRVARLDRELNERITAYTANLALIEQRRAMARESRGDASPREHVPAKAVPIPGDDASTRLVQSLLDQADRDAELNRVAAKNAIDETAPPFSISNLPGFIKMEIEKGCNKAFSKTFDELKKFLEKQQAAAIIAADATSAMPTSTASSAAASGAPHSRLTHAQTTALANGLSVPSPRPPPFVPAMRSTAQRR